MKDKNALLFLFACVLMVSGCTAISVRTMSNGSARFYPGVREDARMIAHPSEVDSSTSAEVLTVACGTVDMVPSAAFDTLLFPFELIPLKNNSLSNAAPATATP